MRFRVFSAIVVPVDRSTAPIGGGSAVRAFATSSSSSASSPLIDYFLSLRDAALFFLWPLLHVVAARVSSLIAIETFAASLVLHF